MVPASRGPHGQRCWCFFCSRDPSCRNPRAAAQCKGPSRAQRASPFYLVRPVRLRAGCWRRVSLQVGARVGVPVPQATRPPARAHRADETIPVLPPHVGTGSEIDAELLVGAQHALGEVGEEGCSFPMGQHAFHKLCSETQEWGCSTPRGGKRSQPSSVSKALNQTSHPAVSPYSALRDSPPASLGSRVQLSHPPRGQVGALTPKPPATTHPKSKPDLVHRPSSLARRWPCSKKGVLFGGSHGHLRNLTRKDTEE